MEPSCSALSSSELLKHCNHYGLSIEEHERICEILGRAPQGLEWPLFLLCGVNIVAIKAQRCI